MSGMADIIVENARLLGRAEALANQIQGILSEASTSLWPEAEVRSHLLLLSQERPVPTA